MHVDPGPWRDRLAELDAGPPARRIAVRDRRTADANAADHQTLAEQRAQIARALADAVLAALAGQRIELTWLDPGSQLTDKQVQQLLNGGDGPGDVYDQLDDAWLADDRYDAARQLIREAVDDDALFGLLDADSELFDEVRLAVQDADISDPLGALLRNTGSRLLLIPLDFEVPDHMSRDDPDELIEQICAVVGVDPHVNRPAVAEALGDAGYGGQLTLIVYADVADAVGAAHLRITDPYLLIHDRLHGSGADLQVSGTVDLPLEDGNVRLDSQTRYGWDDIAAVVPSAYAPTAITWIRPEPEENTAA